MQRWPYLMISIGAALWGIIGFFIQGLYQLGLNSLQIVAVRMLSASIILLVFVWIKDKSLLKITLKDWPYFIGTGILSFVFFNWCYFTAIKEMSLSLAVILLYTAPVFVAIMSKIVFHEPFTSRKLLSLVLTFLGISFVIGFLPNLSGVEISLFGLMVGIGSGIGYALYSIFGKAALGRFHSLTVTTYTFVFASAAIVPASGLWEVASIYTMYQPWLYTLGLGIFPTALALFFYTAGLSQVESSRASIIATVEPIVATLLGILFYDEALTLLQFVGIGLVLIAVIMIQEKERIQVSQSDAEDVLL